jgi:hypothetical protein
VDSLIHKYKTSLLLAKFGHCIKEKKNISFNGAGTAYPSGASEFTPCF